MTGQTRRDSVSSRSAFRQSAVGPHAFQEKGLRAWDCVAQSLSWYETCIRVAEQNVVQGEQEGNYLYAWFWTLFLELQQLQPGFKAIKQEVDTQFAHFGGLR